MYKIKLELPKCDSKDVLKVEYETDDLELVKEVAAILSKALGVTIGYSRKGGGDG